MAHRKIERTSANTLEEVEGLLLQIGIKRFLTSSVWMSSIAISPILGKTWFVNLLKVFASALTLFFQKLFWARSLTQFKAHWLKLTFCFSDFFFCAAASRSSYGSTPFSKSSRSSKPFSRASAKEIKAVLPILISFRLPEKAYRRK